MDEPTNASQNEPGRVRASPDQETPTKDDEMTGLPAQHPSPPPASHIVPLHPAEDLPLARMALQDGPHTEIPLSPGKFMQFIDSDR